MSNYNKNNEFLEHLNKTEKQKVNVGMNKFERKVFENSVECYISHMMNDLRLWSKIDKDEYKCSRFGIDPNMKHFLEFNDISVISEYAEFYNYFSQTRPFSTVYVFNFKEWKDCVKKILTEKYKINKESIGKITIKLDTTPGGPTEFSIVTIINS